MLTWNLFHGRALPPAGRDLLPEFGAALASWDWDVALLQEVPPWWPPVLGARCGAHARTALTARNALLPLRRAIAERAPDLIKSGGGGSNAILVRAAFAPPPTDHRTLTLRWWPEHRVAHGVQVQGLTPAQMQDLTPVTIVNLHAQVHSDAQANADVAKAAAAWADAPRLVLGGDMNLRAPEADGLTHVGGHWVDHVFARGFTGTVETLDRGRLSDHAPVVATLAPRV